MANVKKKSRVVLLTTGNNAPFFLHNTNNRLYLSQGFGEIGQHLYITSDEEIKEGDWFIDDVNAVRQSVTDDEEYWAVRQDYKKIISTTDSSLTLINKFNIHYDLLPQPSPQFIEKYIEAYNAGNPIVDVMVEYEGFGDQRTNLKGKKVREGYRLKIDKSNYITIARCKESWSREEVEKKLFEFNKWRKESGDLGMEEPAIIVKWIEDNL